MNDFKRTFRALDQYEAERESRLQLWKTATTAEHLTGAVNADTIAVDRVRVAFALDTAAFNPPEYAQLIHPDQPDFRRSIGYPAAPLSY